MYFYSGEHNCFTHLLEDTSDPGSDYKAIQSLKVLSLLLRKDAGKIASASFCK